MKGVNEKINEYVLQWSGHMERMENDKIPKRVYVGECADSHLVGQPQKRWIDTMRDCLKKKGSDVKQPRGIVHDRNEWHGFVRRNVWCVAWGMNP